MPERIFPVPDALVGERVDAALTRMTGLSRSAVAKIIDGGGVLADGIPCKKSDRLTESALLQVDMPQPRPQGIEPTPVGMDIIFEDEDIVVVNKPVGVAAHTGPGWEGPTVIGALIAAGRRVATSGPVERQGIVHRLDVGTSGAMVVTKSEVAYSRLKNAFRYRRVDKVYHALVQGHPDPSSGTIEASIGRHPGKEFKMGVVEGGKFARTHYDTLEAMPGASLLKVHLETGRTHQIRVHMQAIGHPLVGDPTYGGDPKMAEKLGLTRQWLHAAELGFEHPVTCEKMVFHAPYPTDLVAALDVLRL
ncbi:MAG: RluA family pseudouridine synthase [Actinomycetaceae bacterium]|nr:RluA family pseudouridine synthase [Actinomycetaceae bacterium]